MKENKIVNNATVMLCKKSEYFDEYTMGMGTGGTGNSFDEVELISKMN